MYTRSIIIHHSVITPKKSKNASIERSEGGSVKVMLRPFKKSPPTPNFNTC